MTLKEKFYDILPQWVNNKDAENCEQIADEFAIGFGEWIDNLPEYYLYPKLTTKELLEIYKIEKGL